MNVGIDWRKVTIFTKITRLLKMTLASLRPLDSDDAFKNWREILFVYERCV